jgi:two-component system OmpR family response regulator
MAHEDPLRLIVVEDDTDLREEIVAFLQARHMIVRAAESGEQLRQALAVEECDIVILDLGLPGEDGLAVAAGLRAYENMAVIMMTARGRVEERITGLTVGADMYLVKPVDLRELEAAVRAVSRRLRPSVEAKPDRRPDSGFWTFDPIAWTLAAPQGSVVQLTAAEVGFIGALTANPGTPVPRRTIASALGAAAADDDRRLDALVRRLRRKVEDEVGDSLPVQAAHAFGYVFNAPIRVRTP